MVLMMLVWNPVLAQQAAESESGPVIIRDVRLGSSDRLVLHVVDLSGQPLAGVPVMVSFDGRPIAQTVTDAFGVTEVTGLRTGVHSVYAGGPPVAMRFWKASAAPPSSLDRPALVVDRELALGQYGSPMMFSGPMGGAPMMGGVGPTLLAAGVTAAAVVLVLAGKNGSDESVVAPASP